MKRSFNTISNGSSSMCKGDETLEGLVVAVTDLSNNQAERKGKYWTALICDSNQNINRITKYLSSKTICSLHVKMLQYLKDQTGIKLNKLRSSGDRVYTTTNETTAITKPVVFTPTCTRIVSIREVQSMSDGDCVTLTCNIVDIGSDDAVVFNNGEKRVQKLKRTLVVSGKTDSLEMTLWQNHFSSVQQNVCYTIKLAKIKVFNAEVSITTGIYTTFDRIEDIGETNCSDSTLISHESTLTGVITSIALLEKQCACPACYSTNVECYDKTIKCNSCKSRSLNVANGVDRDRLKISIMNIDGTALDLNVNAEKIRVLLNQSNHRELFEADLIENEDVLIALSSMNVSVCYKTKTKHISTIKIIDRDE
ncbi:unnamed protein product [Adineta ricciae]|uniref:Uncharacterized protein n=1 Tax=Adineta ricciae TaxID=249248 RepID=A0A815V0V9_ADIRI|nr:unnamed protein product [Adineta ricciae]CAF1639397.1 unnamed protein product [Adineta ricciae]